MDALHAFISGEVKSEPPTLGDLSRAFLNSPDGFVSLREQHNLRHVRIRIEAVAESDDKGIARRKTCITRANELKI